MYPSAGWRGQPLSGAALASLRYHGLPSPPLHATASLAKPVVRQDLCSRPCHSVCRRCTSGTWSASCRSVNGSARAASGGAGSWRLSSPPSHHRIETGLSPFISCGRSGMRAQPPGLPQAGGRRGTSVASRLARIGKLCIRSPRGVARLALRGAAALGERGSIGPGFPTTS